MRTRDARGASAQQRSTVDIYLDHDSEAVERDEHGNAIRRDGTGSTPGGGHDPDAGGADGSDSLRRADGSYPNGTSQAEHNKRSLEMAGDENEGLKRKKRHTDGADNDESSNDTSATSKDGGDAAAANDAEDSVRAPPPGERFRTPGGEP